MLLIVAQLPLQAQYYLRGEIKDETQKPLANVKMMLHSSGYLYYTGTYGGFGITSANPKDSVTLSLEGYQSRTVSLENGRENNFVLKLIAQKQTRQERRLMSVTRGLPSNEKANVAAGGETYSNLSENEYMDSHRFPDVDFAINTDKASYSNIRRFLNMGSTVPPDAVRIEEMLNYFDLGYDAPEGDKVFNVQSKLSDCPWKPGNQLLFIKASAKKLDLQNIPPSNLVFLVDISGSMDMPNRLPLLKSAFKLMIDNLRPIDTVSIVVYGGSVGVWLIPTSGAEKDKIKKSIEELEPGGSTAGESGIRAAYKLAQSKFIPNGNNRVILATDGDFNVGQTSEEDLERLITQQRQLGIYLTCLGVGMGNYKDSKLEVLAKKGNGNFAYLDDEKEAEKVLVKEITQTMYAVADDALLHVKFQPDAIRSYRLLGFDNKRSAIADTSSVLEGGELGSGHTMMAVFELEKRDSLDASAIPPYLADVELSYKIPGETQKMTCSLRIGNEVTPFIELPRNYRFATGLVLFGSLLKESRFIKNGNWIDLQTIMTPVVRPQEYLDQEFLALMEKARKLYYKGKPLRSRGGHR
ncbi:vWA domain-containing protein [Flavihumibacter petaseus]|uniref:VWFA domain-containing protein n=1 Tax=Flavihumibacter petaseus NBRC 106054 TaxID=1220578 RepID=A0A0E9MUR2_9BACT|nr:VWA domain-containing protein [Flavihumibacter petaseus]GAO41319.1 hypothetical protein FPE01S_01_03310 [Flavihumibacter petaseus NBRC 106054]